MKVDVVALVEELLSFSLSLFLSFSLSLFLSFSLSLFASSKERV
jgi:hypothetical protein